jgi:hypothetical protein
LDQYHYNFPKLEIYHYNSSILNHTIIISTLSEIYHHIPFRHVSKIFWTKIPSSPLSCSLPAPFCGWRSSATLDPPRGAPTDPRTGTRRPPRLLRRARHGLLFFSARPAKARQGQSRAPMAVLAVGAKPERRRPRALRRRIYSSSARSSSAPPAHLGQMRRVHRRQWRILGPSTPSHGGELLLLPHDQPGAPMAPHGAAARHVLPRTELAAERRAGLAVGRRCDNPPRKIPYYRLKPIHIGH